MSKLKEVVLLENEETLYQIQGNAYTDSANPLIKLITSIFRIIYIILGVRLKTYIVVTNRRIIRVDKKTVLWGIIPSDTVVSTLNKRTIQSVGYAKAVRWLFFKTIYFKLENMTENITITYKGSMDEVANIVQKISEIVSE